MPDGDVHTAHCCIHTCKYGENDCTVKSGAKKQEHRCENIEFCGRPRRDCRLCYEYGHNWGRVHPTIAGGFMPCGGDEDDDPATYSHEKHDCQPCPACNAEKLLKQVARLDENRVYLEGINTKAVERFAKAERRLMEQEEITRNWTDLFSEVNLILIEDRAPMDGTGPRDAPKNARRLRDRVAKAEGALLCSHGIDSAEKMDGHAEDGSWKTCSCTCPRCFGARVTGMAEDEVARLEGMLKSEHDENTRLNDRDAALEDFVEKVAGWREDAHAYDRDAGHEPRPFNDSEDWDNLETLAKKALTDVRDALDVEIERERAMEEKTKQAADESLAEFVRRKASTPHNLGEALDAGREAFKDDPPASTVTYRCTECHRETEFAMLAGDPLPSLPCGEDCRGALILTTRKCRFCGKPWAAHDNNMDLFACLWNWVFVGGN